MAGTSGAFIERVPQQRRLIRTPDLAAFRETLMTRALAGTPADIRRRVLILPSRGAIELFRRNIEDVHLKQASAAVVLPLMLTREDWLADIAAAMPDQPQLIGRIEREVLFDRAAARAAIESPPPFDVRPGLVGAMLDFYDELRRRGRTIARFSDVLQEQLAGAEEADDRGTHELMRQTAFLTRVFEEYEASVAEARLDTIGEIVDEHVLRARLLQNSSAWPIDHVIVAVADHPTDPRGLWPADFDLLGRLPGVLRLEVIVTEEAHDAGFRERIDREIPDLVDTRITADRSWPSLLVPEGAGERVCTDYRDREEEVRAVTRMIRARAADAPSPLERTAIVFQRPLPYLYIAQQVLAEAGVPYQAFDTLPLSAEPWAALLDLALAVARSGGTRDSALALLRSPLLHIELDGERITAADVSELDRLLIEGRVSSSPLEYPAFIVPVLEEQHRKDPVRDARVLRTAKAAAELCARLEPFQTEAAASAQIDAVATVLRVFERRPPDANRERHLRARSAVLTSLDRLAHAYHEYDDRRRDPDALSAAIHRWIERQTFTPRRGTTGVQLIDAVAARFGSFDHIHIVGLVDAEWPERQRRSIFYTSSLLKELGWPTEVDHLRSQQAAFRDLVLLPHETLSLSAFQLEGDAVVASTPLADEARMLPKQTTPARDVRIFADERLALAPLVRTGLDPGAQSWLALREVRPELTSAAYRGDAGPQPAREYRVSTLDRFAECPFKYFSAAVLRLDEEAEEESALTPRERGTMLHKMFETFYREWDAAGRGAISMANLPDAIAEFERLANEQLSSLPEADRVIESARLLGSVVMRGAAERVFQREAEEPKNVRRRWLEHALNGSYEFPGGGFAPAKTIAIRGVADRIDELEDGTLRLVDYKLTRPPGKGAVQLKVYGHAAQQYFQREDGKTHTVSAADYISFGDDGEPITPLARKGSSIEQAVLTGAQEFAAHVAKIETGQFPPKPENAGLCEWCSFALVCRKETAGGEEDDAAESV